MKSTTKKITINALGIALFVAISLCLRVPVFQNYYLCLGYFVMTFYCYSLGVISGTFVGTVGVVLYCLITGGIKGLYDVVWRTFLICFNAYVGFSEGVKLIKVYKYTAFREKKEILNNFFNKTQ
jgi:uncharacterized membrane protein